LLRFDHEEEEFYVWDLNSSIPHKNENKKQLRIYIIKTADILKMELIKSK
jgi:hypothetical protein